MILNIRGGLGTQVLELLIGLQKARLRNEIIDEIHINVGGNVVNTVRHDYISSIFTISVPVIISTGTLKQNVWTKENFELLSELDVTDPRIGIFIKKTFPKHENETILHVRGKDRQTITTYHYQELLNDIRHIMFERNIKVLGDDSTLINNLKLPKGVTVVSSNPIDDWIRCYRAEVLYSSFSSFTLSAMMFDPHKIFYLTQHEFCDGPFKIEKRYYDMIDILLDKKFTNSLLI